MHIQAADLGVTIDGTPIFTGIELDLDGGHMVALTGPSGSGKTTLLNCLGLILQPSSGEVTINGQVTNSWRDKRRTAFWAQHAAFIYQDYGIVEDETVAYNTTFKSFARGEADDILRHVGLDGRKDARAGVLSGGEKQRLGVARAMYKHADVIYADEPTASLDEDNRNLVSSLLRERANAGVLVIIATHDNRLVRQCDTEYKIR
ncbi:MULTISPECIES: ATP-binding cassette domain-containing protein [unclassified Actinobaculum]|uniref:ABC transporter ATP-binding protein n=1 Tax=unclassified Actinobaculum TaxID=2609299 RepID=UPI000D526916|nr:MULTISPECIES: ATP-binding cassette domain-containing protein [unclassified Actinobaculum]AWE43196.1 hypothetical protein DDD63_11075 [Actinobaculum sp. 313]RTE49904.1 ATP-binding cassette domain-containing protein [Actinobaculum sp. 352]